MDGRTMLGCMGMLHPTFVETSVGLQRSEAVQPASNQTILIILSYTKKDGYYDGIAAQPNAQLLLHRDQRLTVVSSLRHHRLCRLQRPGQASGQESAPGPI